MKKNKLKKKIVGKTGEDEPLHIFGEIIKVQYNLDFWNLLNSIIDFNLIIPLNIKPFE